MTSWGDLQIDGKTSFGENYFETTGNGVMNDTIPISPGLYLKQKDGRLYRKPAGTMEWEQYIIMADGWKGWIISATPAEQPQKKQNFSMNFGNLVIGKGAVVSLGGEVITFKK